MYNFKKNAPGKVEIKWDEKDVKKSFNTIESAVKKLIADFNSMKSKSIEPLNKKIDAIERALPNKNDILKNFKRDIEDSKRYIMEDHRHQLEEKLKPEKLKIVINDIIADTQKQKDNEIRMLSNEVASISQLRESKSRLEKEKKQLVEQCDTFDEKKKIFEREITDLKNKIDDLESEKVSLINKISLANDSEKLKRDKYQDLYNNINEYEDISIIVDMLNRLSSLKELKSIYGSSGDLFDFERKFAVLIGRLILENKFKHDKDILTVIDEVNKRLDTYEIVHPKFGDHQIIDYNIERTVNGKDVPGLFIKEYITLCVKNKTINTADSIIKALVDAS